MEELALAPTEETTWHCLQPPSNAALACTVPNKYTATTYATIHPSIHPSTHPPMHACMRPYTTVTAAFTVAQ
jgi:hypothetical protein